MIKVEVNMPEVVERCKELISKPGEVIRFIKHDLRREIAEGFERLMGSEITLSLGRRWYERRRASQPNRRNGHCTRRYTIRWLGEMAIRVPRDRLGFRWLRYDAQRR
jgi:transposase-like protein